jgi:NodT family efflux transporter outer membrane factor (OMF) lipoprotein
MTEIQGNSEKQLWGPVALVLCAVFVLHGCAVGPDYVKPTVPEPKQWLEEGNPKVEVEDADFTTWWKVFDDPVLDSLVESAYMQNLDLQLAGIRILQARAQLGVAIGSLYPQQQSGVGSYSRINLSENTANVPLERAYSDYDIGFDAAWELDFWGKFRRGVESGIGSLEASIASYDDILVTLTSEVARTYVVIRTLEERLDIARQNVKIQERSLQIARVRFEGGDVTELDVAQARSLLHTTQALIPELEIGLRQAKNGLAVLLGKMPGEVDEMLQGQSKIPAAPATVAIGLPAELLRRRPDIRRAERQLASQSARIGVAKADLFPHFVLFGSIGWRADSSSDWLTAGSFRGIGGPGFSWDIFNYGRIRNRIRVEDSRFQELVVNYENTVLKAVQETEDALASFLRSQEKAYFLGQAVDASKRSVDLSMIQYKEGLADYQRVLDTQRALAIQQDSHTATSGDVVLNLVAIYKSLGGGWKIRQGKPFVDEGTKKQMRERTNWGRLLEPETEAPPTDDKDRLKWRAPEW